MSQRNLENITFQIIVNQLTVPHYFPEHDIRVTVTINDVSKITCSGRQSEDGLIVTWNHPFWFTASPLSVVEVAMWILPDELTLKWNKLSLSDKIAKNVAGLVESDNIWQCNLYELSSGPATLSISYKESEILNTSSHDCLSLLTEYKWKLYNFSKNFHNTACIATLIEVNLARLDLCPLGHPEHTSILKYLAAAFQFSYDQLGNISDLNKAINIQQTRLEICSEDHPEHADALGELVMTLSRHYDIQKHKKDLNKLIEMEYRWLDLCPLGHKDHAKALGELASSLMDHYEAEQNITDLNKAIELEEKRFYLCPEDHEDHEHTLNNLASSISMRYQQLGSLTDLDRAIDLQEKCLGLCPLGHQAHGVALQNLAISLWYRYDVIKTHSDLNRATRLLKEVLNLYPVQHPHFASGVTQLANLLLYNPPHPSDQPSSPNEAFEIYRLLKKCSPAVSLDLLMAVQDWIQSAKEYNHPSILEAYQTLLDALDHFTSLNSSLDSRHETMQARVSDLANNAFSCAIKYSDLQMAVELLEQGRGILWNQLARFDTSVAALESLGHELRKKFTQLSVDLKKHAEQSGSHTTDPYWQVLKEWQSVVDGIRCLDGFSRFLLPPHFDDLQQAAEYGPVIIVNASEYSCDALIILHASAPVHVPLRCSLNDIVQLCSQLSELTQDPHAYGTHRELYLKEFLRDLWSCVVEQIVIVLQNDVQLPPGSRIWWCPTSKFTTLPLHGAGLHRKGEKNLMDIYISSYALSLSALLRTRDRLGSQKTTRGSAGLAKIISFAAVGQAHPGADTKLSQLPEVEHEIRRIRDETNMSPDVQFESVTGAAASIDGAVQAFRDHRWVHVACHGAQHAEKPFDSWFAMGDGKLTLMRIIQERYTNSEFAFLSACHTAVGDASTPDEVLHLAAGMQFSGFNGVIGTLWRVDDSVAHQMVTRFYKEMFKYPVVDFENAAAALNTAALETADEVSLEKRIVFVHIGI